MDKPDYEVMRCDGGKVILIIHRHDIKWMTCGPIPAQPKIHELEDRDGFLFDILINEKFKYFEDAIWNDIETGKFPVETVKSLAGRLFKPKPKGQDVPFFPRED